MSKNVYEQLLETTVIDDKHIQQDLLKRQAFNSLLPVEKASFVDKPD